MSTVGYARVSTDHQSLEAQRDALTAAGCERIFTDTLSGARDDRPGLAALLDYTCSGDVVVVAALDRLGRSLSGVIRTVETLTEAGVLLRSLREGIDYSTPTGRMLAGDLRSLAAYERELVHERAAAARAAARARGRHTGRLMAFDAGASSWSGPARKPEWSTASCRGMLTIGRPRCSPIAEAIALVVTPSSRTAWTLAPAGAFSRARPHGPR